MKRKIIAFTLAGAILFVANICIASSIVGEYTSAGEEVCWIVDNLETEL